MLGAESTNEPARDVKLRCNRNRPASQQKEAHRCLTQHRNVGRSVAPEHDAAEKTRDQLNAFPEASNTQTPIPIHARGKRNQLGDERFKCRLAPLRQSDASRPQDLCRVAPVRWSSRTAALRLSHRLARTSSVALANLGPSNERASSVQRSRNDPADSLHIEPVHVCSWPSRKPGLSRVTGTHLSTDTTRRILILAKHLHGTIGMFQQAECHVGDELRADHARGDTA